MNKDPVFSFNVGLPNISNTHQAKLIYHCNLLGTDSDAALTPATLVTESGWSVDYPHGSGVGVFSYGNGSAGFNAPGGPSSERIEILRESGQPEVVTDNTSRISSALHTGGGCTVGIGGRASRNAVGAFGLVAVAALMLLRRRRA
jgi:MYXO-CTERM domain-containing protein